MSGRLGSEIETDFSDVHEKKNRSPEMNYMHTIDGGNKDQDMGEFVIQNTIIVRIPILRVKKLTEDAILPTQGSPGAAGWDVCSTVDIKILGIDSILIWKHVISISTGLAFQIPPGYRVSVRPRSGLAFKHGITVINSPGTIDSDYRGELKIGLVKLTPGNYTVKKGDRVAQICLEKVEEFSLREVDNIDETERGEEGIGSTGK